MNNTIQKKLYLVIAALMISQSSFAEVTESIEDNWYIGGGVGQSRLQPEGHGKWEVSDKSDFSKKVYGGMNIGRDFSLEAFWNDLGAAEVMNKSGNTADVSYQAYGANLVYHVPSYFGSVHPIVKLGVGKIKTKGDGVDINQKNKFDVMGGIGAEYELSAGFRVRAEYERFDKDIEQVSIGINWRPVLKQRSPKALRPVQQESKRPIIIVNNQAPAQLAAAPKTVIKRVYIKQPAPPPIVKTIVKHVPATPQPVVQRITVNNPMPKPKPKPKPQPQPQPKVIHKTLAGGSNFATNSASLTGAGQNALNRVANDIIRNQVVIHNIAIIGHTDNVGSHAANQRLSQQRAATVANYLASRGLNRGLMTVVGRGETQPIANNATAAGRAKNRRVKLVVKGSQTITR